MRWIKTIGFIVLSGALAGFNVLFLDRLAERGLEQALEGIFHAKAEVEQLDISPMKARVTFQSITIADEQEPMSNLFELGPTDIDLDLEELLKKKLVIESVVSQDIQWGTERLTSGEISESGRTRQADISNQERVSDILQSVGLDPDDILERERANLKSPAAAEQLKTDLTETRGKWESSVATTQTNLATVEEEIERARQIDVGSIDTIPEAQSALVTMGEITGQLKEAQETISTVGREMQAEISELQSRSREVQQLVAADTAYLQSRVAMPEEGLKGVMADMAGDLVAAKLGRFSGLALRALDYAKGMRADHQKEREAPGRRGGHDVPFATTVYPKFLVKNLAFTASHDDQSLDGGLTDLSSDPDMWDRPTTFRADVTDGDRRLDVQGAYDGRRDARAAYSLSVAGAGYPLDLESIPALAGSTGIYQFRTDLEIDPAENTRGAAMVTVTQIEVAQVDNADLITGIVRDALAEADQIVFDISYTILGGKLDLDIKSNVDDEISRQISQRMGELLAGYRKQLEQALNDELRPILGENSDILGDLGGKHTQIGSAEGQLAGYRSELEAKTDALNEKASAGVRDTLKDTAGKIKLPSFGR